jgi:hypothetical protein
MFVTIETDGMVNAVRTKPFISSGCVSPAGTVGGVKTGVGAEHVCPHEHAANVTNETIVFIPFILLLPPSIETGLLETWL